MNRHCVSQLVMPSILVSWARISCGPVTDMVQASHGSKIPLCKAPYSICFVAQNGKTGGRGVTCNSKWYRLGYRLSIYPYRTNYHDIDELKCLGSIFIRVNVPNSRLLNLCIQEVYILKHTQNAQLVLYVRGSSSLFVKSVSLKLMQAFQLTRAPIIKLELYTRTVLS